jgi:hypothetical protein
VYIINIIFSEWEAPGIIQEQSAQIRMIIKMDTKQVENFSLQELGSRPKVRYTVCFRGFTTIGPGL